MDPEDLSTEALCLFNRLPPEGQHTAIRLAETLNPEEAVYIAAMRMIPDQLHRKFLFDLSKMKWGL